MKKRYGLVFLCAGLMGCAHPQTANVAPVADTRTPASEDAAEITVESIDENAMPPVSDIYLRERGGQINDNLQNCGGRAFLQRSGAQLWLVLSGVDCGYYSTPTSYKQRLGGSRRDDRQGNREIKLLVTARPGTTAEYTVGSDNYFDSFGRRGQADRIHVIVDAIPMNKIVLDTRDWASATVSEFGKPLTGCGGWVSAEIEDNSSQLNVKINDTDCTQFDIMTNENRDVRVQPVFIPSTGGRWSTKHGGSFTIPKRVYKDNFGYNELEIRVSGAPGQAESRLIVKFDFRPEYRRPRRVQGLPMPNGIPGPQGLPMPPSQRPGRRH